MVGSKTSSGSSSQRPGGTSRLASSAAATRAQRLSGPGPVGKTHPMPTMAIRGSPGMSEILLFAIQSGQGRCGVAVGKGPREARIDGAFTTFQAGDQPALGIEVIDVGQG